MLKLKPWPLEHKKIATTVAAATNIVLDISDIIAVYSGSRHSKAMDNIGSVYFCRIHEMVGRAGVDTDSGDKQKWVQTFLKEIAWTSCYPGPDNTLICSKELHTLIRKLSIEDELSESNIADVETIVNLIYEILLLAW